MSHGRPLVLPSGVGQSQGSALLTPAEVLLLCPDQMQVGEALMTKEAEAPSDQRAWSSMVFRLIRRRWWSMRQRKKGGPLAARRVQTDVGADVRDVDERHLSDFLPSFRHPSLVRRAGRE